MSAATRLVRSKAQGGARVHLAECRHVVPGTCVPWIWAEGRDDDEWLRLGHFKPCRVCLPALAARLADAKTRAAVGGDRG